MSGFSATGKQIWVGAGAFVLIVLAVVLQTPDPLSVIHDQDMGVQMAGAQQIAAGEKPFIDWRGEYGPVKFYGSYLALVVGHGRIGAEILLCELGYAIAYGLFFFCAREITGSSLAALLTTAAACVLFPRLHKYFIALGPMWTLFWIICYVRRPTGWRLFLLGLPIVLTGLYRLDFGLYAFLAVLPAVVLNPIPLHGNSSGQRGEQIRQLVVLSASVLFFAAPWLLFLGIHHSVIAYFSQAVLGGVGMAVGLSLPFPMLDLKSSFLGISNLQAMSFAGMYLAFLLAVGMVVWRWRELESGRRKILLATIILAGGGLVQSMHRSDYGHLLQATITNHLLGAFVIVEAVRQIGRRRFLMSVPAAMVAAAYAATIAAGLLLGAVRPVHTTGLAAWKWFYSPPLDQAMNTASARYPGDTLLQAVVRTRAIVPPGGRVFCAPYFPSIYSLSGRLFAGGQLDLAPGYFIEDRNELKMIADLRHQGLPPIVEGVGPGDEYDGLSQRSSRALAPKVFQFIEKNYAVDTSAGMPPGFQIWIARRDHLRSIKP